MLFVIEEIFSATVLTNTESYLLGITFAVFTLFDALMEMDIAPIRGSSSDITTKQPFEKNIS